MSHDGQFNTAFDAIRYAIKAEPEAPVWSQPDTALAKQEAPAPVVQAVPQVTHYAQPVPQVTLPPQYRTKDAAPAVPVWARKDAHWASRISDEPVVDFGVTVIPATFLTGAISLSSDWLSTGMAPAALAGLIGAASLALGVKVLLDNGNMAVGAVAVGLAVADVAGIIQVACPWGADIAAWFAYAALFFGLRRWYRLGTSEKRDKSLESQAEVRLTDSKARKEEAKANQLDVQTWLLMQKHEREMAPEALPYLGGATPEEQMLRTAFWHGLKKELQYCTITPTLTGWVAVIGLPVTLNRNAARQGWDKVSSAMSADGRFALADGRRTNELEVRFLAAGKSGQVSSAWHPGMIRTDGMVSLGYNTETGAEVLVPMDARYVWAGASGSGKSWSLRPFMATAHTNGDLAFLDCKGEESYGAWSHVARCAVEPEELIALVGEINEEMRRRRDVMKAKGLSKWDGEQLTVVADENQDLLFHLGNSKAGGGDDVMQMYRRISSQGRSRGVVLLTATQKPTYSSGGGLDTQMAGNVDQRFCLRVATAQESQTALDAYADYAPHLISKDLSTRGQGYLAGYGPALIQTWTVDDAAVRALPVKVWRGQAAVDASLPPAERVAAFLAANPGASLNAISEGTGVPRSSVSDIRKGL
jgi:hypothetical protein